MCGIAGLSVDPNRAIDKALLQRMTATLRHRGPDSEGYFVADGIGMGVRCLAVIDVEGGDQVTVAACSTRCCSRTRCCRPG
jgi:asparagine synthase (glutamine-hydrolysing)